MGFRPIQKIENVAPVTSLDNWVSQYKEAFIETQHDTSQLTLINPDDCLVVFGPPRLSQANGSSSDTGLFYPVGFLNMLQVSESRQVQPLKALGSRRHIFSATNTPVQGTIGRMLFLGQNVLHAIYGNASFGADTTDRNSKYGEGAAIYANLEEDIFRVPFGMGVFLNSPASVAGQTGAGGYHGSVYYYEACTLLNKSLSLQAGQTMVMEQVSFMADRCIPMEGVNIVEEGWVGGGQGSIGMVQNVSDMA